MPTFNEVRAQWQKLQHQKALYEHIILSLEEYLPDDSVGDLRVIESEAGNVDPAVIEEAIALLDKDLFQPVLETIMKLENKEIPSGEEKEEPEDGGGKKGARKKSASNGRGKKNGEGTPHTGGAKAGRRKAGRVQVRGG
jgi:hypothetical protein